MEKKVRKVLIVHDFTGNTRTHRDLEQEINRRVESLGPGWVIHSATTSVAIGSQVLDVGNEKIYIQWCTTVVVERDRLLKEI